MLNSQIIWHAEYSRSFIGLMRFFRYLQTGVLLHLMGISGAILSIHFYKLAYNAFENDGWGVAVFYLCLALYFFSLIFFSQLDARSRYQNYKLLKDKLFEYGFDERVIRPFVFSKCQRDAIKVAARELDFKKELTACYFKMGFRWYHILPHLVVKHPTILFTKSYWQKTLFVKSYKSKNFLW